MTSIMRFTVCGVAVGLSLAALPAFAHDPGLEMIPVGACWAERNEVVCESAWSKGRIRGRVTVDVIGYDNRVMLSAKTDDKGRFRFPRPNGAFFVLLGDQPGETVEVDWKDIAATQPKGR